MSIQGPDISSHQHEGGDVPDFAKVKAAGYRFVIVKATEGITYYNPYFIQDVKAAHAAGLEVGAYHFVHPQDDGALQANKFLEQVNQVKPLLSLPLALDWEVTDGRPPADTHAQLDKARVALRQNGFRTMTYSYPSFIEEEALKTCTFCASDALWYADYDAHLPTNPSVLAPWKSVLLWQTKGTSASIPGLAGGQDLSVFQGTEADFLHFCGKGPASGLPVWYHRLLEYPPSKLHYPGVTKSNSAGTFQVGGDVQAVQRRLGIKPDGWYGAVTASHVKGFQKTRGLAVDGIVGPATARALG